MKLSPASTAGRAIGRDGEKTQHGIETIEQAYTRTTTDQLQTVEQRIGTAYREIETDEKVRAGQAEARRLRIVVAALVVLLLLGAGIVVLILL